MKRRSVPRGLSLVVGGALMLACQEAGPTDAGFVDRGLETHGEKKLDSAVCAPGGAFTLVSTNPYWPMAVGDRWILVGEEDGETLRVEIEVLGETETFYVGDFDVVTRVVVETECEGEDPCPEPGDDDERLMEISRNYFVQVDGGDFDGTMCYYGEDVDDYEGGEVVSNEGAWRADDPGNAPGIIMPADPVPGTKFQMEGAPGIAEDEGKIVAIGPVTVPAGTFTSTIRVEEANPLEGEKGYKVYAAGVGLLIDETLELEDSNLLP